MPGHLKENILKRIGVSGSLKEGHLLQVRELLVALLELEHGIGPLSTNSL